MKWSKDPPAVPGWYWVRGDFRSKYATDFGPRVVRVVDEYHPHGGGLSEYRSELAVDRGRGHFALMDDWKHVHAEWSGPIPEPEA